MVTEKDRADMNANIMELVESAGPATTRIVTELTAKKVTLNTAHLIMHAAPGTLHTAK